MGASLAETCGSRNTVRACSLPRPSDSQARPVADVATAIPRGPRSTDLDVPGGSSAVGAARANFEEGCAGRTAALRACAALCGRFAPAGGHRHPSGALRLSESLLRSPLAGFLRYVWALVSPTALKPDSPELVVPVPPGKVPSGGLRARALAPAAVPGGGSGDSRPFLAPWACYSLP